MNRKAYPSDVTDEEWALVAPYLTLIREASPQRDYSLRELFNGLRWIIHTGAQTTCRHRRRRISRRSAGSIAGFSRRWCMTCGHCCAWRKGVASSPQRRYSTVGGCNRRRRAEHEQDTMGRNGTKAARCMRRWIPWDYINSALAKPLTASANSSHCADIRSAATPPLKRLRCGYTSIVRAR